MTVLPSGAPVCVEVSLLDGLVYSKTALYHSMNYRSAIVFGRARAIEGEAEKRMIFERRPNLAAGVPMKTAPTHRRVPGRLGVAVLAVFLLAAGCNGKTIPIGDLLANAAGYDGKTVQVAGTVKSAAGALGYGVYQVEDETGAVMVVTESGGAPAQGTKIGVQGTFHSAFTIGTDVVAVIVEKERRTR